MRSKINKYDIDTLKQAKKGHPGSLCTIGHRYLHGYHGFKENKHKAFKLFAKAAKTGYAEALFELGRCYYNGYGTAQDYKKALELFLEAYEKNYDGYSDGLMYSMIGNCYYYGRGTAQDYTEAVKWHKLGSEYGVYDSHLVLASCYVNGDGVEKDPIEAARLYFLAYKSVSMRIQNVMNILSRYGLKQLKSEIKNGATFIVEATLCIGMCYYNGKIFVCDYKLAIEWFEKAAKLGNNNAYYYLGHCYEMGNGVEQDIKRAVELYEKADRSNDDVDYRIGYCYYYGYEEDDSAESKLADSSNAKKPRNNNVRQDYEKAIEHLQAAAKGKNTRAMMLLAECYELGTGVEKNAAKAERLRESANYYLSRHYLIND